MTRMVIRTQFVVPVLVGCGLFLPVAASGVCAAQASQVDGAAKKAPGILTREEAAAVLPATVFYRGQSASIQARNSSGVRLAGGALILATLVDTSGYSSSVQESYQGYLITEEPLLLGDQRLAPGAYGFGFVSGDRMVVMDVGAHEVLHAPTHRDAELHRPAPLQILRDGTTNQYRLYLGRTFVTLTPAP